MLLGARLGSFGGCASDKQCALLLHGNTDSICKMSIGSTYLGNRTVSMWVKLNTYTASGNMRYPALFTLVGNSGSTWYGDCLYANASRSLYYMLIGYANESVGRTVTTGVWTHLAFSINSSNSISVYVNGTKVKSTSNRYAYGKTISTNANIALGCMPWNDGNTYDCLNGYLANVMMFDSALDESDITTLASSLDASISGATHSWQFVDSDDGVLHDTGSVGGYDIPMGTAAEIVEIE